ncbi:hypothetical protein CVT25_008438 [Psilocybe cyanescens]|uniref:Uncharacterized protein n=1 Tax=Psilocybe cyanescens TaxID=93625 RepID=A0A409WUT4_PSICY|nr:hypothetical protein CVT25_008438 [Psilocybe cyanescens]
MARKILSESSCSVFQWQDMPRDVLIEIFLECLPIDPLKHQQPDTTVAPMLLCQICSYWRYVALSAPQLWESLYHVSKNGIRNKDIRFLRWWSKNLKLKSPRLRLRINWSVDVQTYQNPGQAFEAKEEEDQGKTEDPSLFLESLLTSAKYLDLDPSYITILFNYKFGRPLSYPNLDTLVMRQNTCTPTRASIMFRSHLTTVMDRAHTRPIRQLHLESFTFSDRAFLTTFRWSHLAHASVLDIRIALPAWHHLIRALTSLQTGTFHITALDPGDTPDIFSLASSSSSFTRSPAAAALPLLHTLHLSLPSDRTLTAQILRGLALPSLRRLRLASPALSLSSLHTILASTPTLTQLHLCGRIPFCWTSHTICIPPAHPPHALALAHVQQHQYQHQSACMPLPQLLPSLTHLLLDGSIQNNHMVLSWARSVFSSPWLQLPVVQPRADRGADIGGGGGTSGGITHLQLAISNPSSDEGDMSASAPAPAENQHPHPFPVHNDPSPNPASTNPTAHRNGRVATSPFSMERSRYVLQKLRGILLSCELDLARVKVVIRGPDAPKLWSGSLLNEDLNPTFDVPGFEPT